MISIENLSVEFGVKPLFTDVSYVINRHERIALVGKNGAGKSTMLKIIAGLQQPTRGRVNKPKDLTIGYLPQVMVLTDSMTVRQETEKAFADTIRLEQHMERLNKELAERTDYESEEYRNLIEEMTDLNEQLTMASDTNRDAEIERTLTGLGFEAKDFDRPTSEFSGGWRMRIELAKILLRKPDILLLDEPTNHLDIESIQWLERFLLNGKHTLLLISHDRAFLDSVTTRTIEISCSRINDYNVNYSKYVVLHAERIEQQRRAYDNQQKLIQDTEAFIERFRYQATKAVQVQSRIKQLEKIVPIEIEEVDNSHLNLKFPPAPRSGDYPVICHNVRKAYDHVVFDHVELTIKRGEKVAFVGRNGEGKSTLVKCIMGQIPYDGELKVGYGVKIGYFAQNQAQLLDENLSVFDTIDRVAVGDIRTKIRDILGAFMFGGEASDKPVKVLSGGERSRLAMIRLLLEPVNLLILDEPTNHLDMPSKDVLKEAIRAFDGTAIIVSHDREFLDGLVTKVYEFAHGKVTEHLGGIYDYLRAHGASSVNEALQQPAAAPQPAAPQTAKEPTAPAEAPATGKQTYQDHKEQQKKIRRAARDVEESEKKIAQMEARIAELDSLFMQPENAADMRLVTEYTTTREALDKENDRWLQLSEVLENLKADA